MIDLDTLKDRIVEKSIEVAEAKNRGGFVSHEYYSRIVRELYELREQYNVIATLERIKNEFTESSEEE